MTQVWKYPLEKLELNRFEMPDGARALAVQVQDGTPMLWMQVKPQATPVPREIFVVATGADFNTGHFHNYVGTFQLAHGALVFHVYSDF